MKTNPQKNPDSSVRVRRRGDRIAFVIANGAMVACAVIALGILISIAGSRGGMADSGKVIIGVAFATLWIIFAALIFCRLYLGAMTAGAVFSLLGPRRFLKRIPPMLDPVRAKIASGETQEALDRLRVLREEYPDSAAICALILEILMDLPDDAGAREAANAFFTRPGRGRDPEACAMLLDYTAFLADRNEEAEALALLKRELARRCYSGAERKLLRLRAESLEDRN